MKCLEQDEYELCARLTTQMEVDDLCFRMGEMILVKKDSGREAFALKYLKELEKKRSQIVERVWDKKSIAFFVLTFTVAAVLLKTIHRSIYLVWE